MKIIKRIAKILFIIIVLYFALAIITTIGFKQKTNNNPLPHNYKKGVYHLHSQFSDGSGSIQEIARIAGKQNLNFIIVTDHGRPNRESTDATSWQDNVLVIGASEFSLNNGHMAAMGYHAGHNYIYPPEAQEAINEVNETKGVTFISHPFDRKIPWTDWEIHGFTGIEILSTYSSAKRIGLFGLIMFPGQYLFNSNLALLHALDYPLENMRQWDQINGQGRYFGIYALDAHANIKLPLIGQLKYPSYDSLFRMLRVYVKIDRELLKDAQKSSNIIINSLKRGNFFNAVDALATANGFDNYFISETGQKVEMGGHSVSTKGKLILLLPFPFNTNIVVIKDGKPCRLIKNNRPHRLEFDISAAGVYRCEIRISDNSFANLPWILSNPIFIGTPPASMPTKPAGIQKPIYNGKPDFVVEKNSISEAALEYTLDQQGQTITHLKFKLLKKHDQMNFWTALSLRKSMDFSRYQGIGFQVRCNNRLRFFCDLRNKTNTGESWYFHSFLGQDNWQWVFIPFKKFHQIHGKGSALDLKHISALYFTISNFIAYRDTNGHLQIKNLGLY